MPTLHDLMAESIDDLARDYARDAVAPGDGTRARIGRVRRRRAATAGATSALAVGGLVIAGATQDRSRGAGDDLGASGDVASGVSVALVPLEGTGHLSEPLGWDREDWCGKRIDASTVPASQDGFSMSAQVQGVGGDDAGSAALVTTAMTYDGGQGGRAFVDDGVVLLLKDGVVVGTLGDTNMGETAPFRELMPGATWESGAVARLVDPAQIDACGFYPGVGEADAVVFAAGDYEVVAVGRVLASEDLAAEYALYERGLRLADEATGAWVPGSVDCIDAVESRLPNDPSPRVLQCEPGLASDVTIDADAHTASVPYPAAWYAGDLDVTVASAPVAFPLAHDLAWSDLDSARYLSDAASEPPAVSTLACGVATGGRVPDQAEIDASVHGYASIASLLDGEEAPLRLDLLTRQSEGWIDLAQPARAWLVARDLDGTMHVVGEASASLGVTGRIAVDRAAGYPDESLTLGDATWCDGAVSNLTAVVLEVDAATSSSASSDGGTVGGPGSGGLVWVDLRTS